MKYWLLILAFTLICSSICLYTPGYEKGTARGEKPGLIFLELIFIVVMALISGLRSGIGDTGYYLKAFVDYSGYSVSGFIRGLFSQSVKEPGFKLFIILISKVTKTPQALLIVSAFITVGIFTIVIFRKSEGIGLSLFLFLTLGFFVSSMNGLRQMLAVTIVFASVPLIEKKKTIPYIIVILLASTIHTSVLVMLLFYVIARRNPWDFITLLTIILVAIVFLGFNTFVTGFTEMLEGTMYSAYASDILTNTSAGANLFRFLVMLVPVALSFMGRNQYVDDIQYRVYSNAVIINAVIYLFSLFNWIFARIALYFFVSLILFYPYIIKRVFGPKSRRIVTAFLVVFYIVFFIREIRDTTYMSRALNINIDSIGKLVRSIYGM